MKFDTAFIDLNEVNSAEQTNNNLFLRIIPIKYTDNIRKPRLPRKSSKQTNLQVDTNYIFSFAFQTINDFFSSTNRFSIDIKVFKANDRLGGGDLDNYCKAILDAITSTRKVWEDDEQVDEIKIKRSLTTSYPYSYIDLTITKL